jgi:transposase
MPMHARMNHVELPDQVITSYHDLWHVGQSFRMSKTDLRARPMFHHTRDAIEAHLTIVFTALASREARRPAWWRRRCW